MLHFTLVSFILAHVLEKRGFSGQATFYGSHPGDPPPLGIGACENMPSDTGYFVAVGAGAYDKSKCGQCVQVFYQGKSTIGPVADLCPSCGTGLDLSLLLFSELAPSSQGRIDITWDYVPCPAGRGVNGGPVSFAPPTPQQPASNPVQFQSFAPALERFVQEPAPTQVTTVYTTTTTAAGSYPTTTSSSTFTLVASGAAGSAPFMFLVSLLF